jgi:nitrate/nitrite transport system substrate-binding protein
MVANMRVGNMDGYCVGEPWGHRAIIDGIGITAGPPQDIWKDHPEKVLGTTGDFVKKYPNTARAGDRRFWRPASGSTPACRTRTRWPKTIARQELRQHQRGRHQPAHPGPLPERSGKTWDDPNHMKFFNDGAGELPLPVATARRPRTRRERWASLKEHPDDLAGGASRSTRSALYEEAAAAAQGQRAQRAPCAAAS